MPQPVRQRKETARPPVWLLAALALCAAAALIYVFAQGLQPGATAEGMPTPAPTAEPTPTPTATPEPTPTPTPEPDWSEPVPESGAVDQAAWFADAVFIGDSRVDGFHLFSGVTADAAFLDSTGLTVYEALEGKKVIRAGQEKISILDALAQKEYGKVYIALGINELGYQDAEEFGDTFGRFVDAVRQCQPQAQVYVQAIIPVNTAKCRANDQPYYVTNEGIADYNQALADMCAEKKVYRVAVPDGLLDENGETAKDYSADGVHFKREGYQVWLDYLTTHTGGEL